MVTGTAGAKTGAWEVGFGVKGTNWTPVEAGAAASAASAIIMDCIEKLPLRIDPELDRAGNLTQVVDFAKGPPPSAQRLGPLFAD
jgi:hypothetical protein